MSASISNSVNNADYFLVTHIMNDEIINWLQIPTNSVIAKSLEGGFFELSVLGLLLLMSAISWGIIFYKGFSFQFIVHSYRIFFKHTDLYSGMKELKVRAGVSKSAYPAQLFNEAYREYEYSIGKKDQKMEKGFRDDLLKRIERKVEKSIIQQNTEMEKGLNILATISGSAPFIGLFGTVIGIIDAFHSIGDKGTSSIAVVAPGISSALLATGLGLFTAIPALIAFNVFRNKNRNVNNDMRGFGLELLNLFDRESSCYSKT